MSTDLFASLTEGVHFITGEDGRRWPLVAGGSDTGVADAAAPAGGGEAAPPAPAGDAAPPDGATAPPAGEGTDAGFEALADEYGKLPQEQVSRWSKEHADYRRRYDPIAKAVNALSGTGIDPADLTAALTHLGDPQRAAGAAKWLRGVLDHVSPAEAAAITEAVNDQGAGGQPDAGDDFDPFDKSALSSLIAEQVKAALGERDQSREQERQMAEAKKFVETKAAELADAGPKGPDGKPLYRWDDPSSRHFRTLTLVAQTEFAHIGDPAERLTAAAEAISGENAEFAKHYWQGKSADAEHPTAPENGQAPSGRKDPADFDEADKRARARLDRLNRGDVGA